MMTTTTRDVLISREGLNAISTVEVDDDGTPVTEYGYEFRPAGTTELLGWGELDGAATVWEHIGGAYEILIPVS